MKRKWWIAGLLIALALALVSPLASAKPDGLERVAEDLGFVEDAQHAPYELIADYAFPSIGSDAGATIMAGIVGVALVFGLSWGLGVLLRGRDAE